MRGEVRDKKLAFASAQSGPLALKKPTCQRSFAGKNRGKERGLAQGEFFNADGYVPRGFFLDIE
jgi:hypothetical protein